MSSENSRIQFADMPKERIVLKPGVHKALWGEESWEVSAHESDPNAIADGPFAGRRLNDVFPRFPLLFKTIRANDALSVQVHPNERTAVVSGGEPKTEMWCALKDSTVYAGLKPGTDAATLEAAVRDGTADSLLVRHDLKAGDTLLVPGGLVHAIAGGSTLYEVQQSSNTTFRLYDWGRVGADGKPRQLHVSEALRATDYALQPTVVRASQENTFFSFRQARLSGELRVCGEGRFVVVRSVSGGFSLNGEEFSDGASVLLPPSVPGVLRTDGAWLLLTEFAP